MGKGSSHQMARVSALMEAIERVAAEATPEPPVRACAEDLDNSAKVVDPWLFDLPPDTSYRHDIAVDWSEGFDLLAGVPVFVPTDLVICPPRDGVISQPDTNGLASGNSRLEATVHGLCEVIERDAMGQWAFASLYGDSGRRLSPSIDVASLPEDSRKIVETARAQRLRVRVSCLPSNIAIPTFHAVLIDPSYLSSSGPGLRRFDGFGCHPDAEVALSRALNEAAQSRLAIIQGGRDSYNHLPRGIASLESEFSEAGGTDEISFDMVPSRRTDDLGEDLGHILSALEDGGRRHAIMVDLTVPDSEIAVVRVRVAGLSSFFVDRSRVGWRSLAHLV